MSFASTLTSPIAPTQGAHELFAPRQYLESEYTKNRRPDSASRAVMVWFQNRRQKDNGSRMSSPACTPTPAIRTRTPIPTCPKAPTTQHAASPKLPPTPTTPSFGAQTALPCSPMTLPASHFPPTPAMSTPELHFDDSDLEGDFNHLTVPGAVVLTPLISPHPRPTLPMHEPSHMSIDTSRPSSPLLSASALDMPPRVTLPPPQAHANDQPGCMHPARFKWVMSGQTMLTCTGAGHPVPRPVAPHGAAFKWPSLPRLVPMMDDHFAEPPKTPTLPPILSASTLSSPLDALREVCAREHAVMASSGRPHAARARAGAAPY
ncbi:hypothetical protein BCR44DRAFT_1440260 [Catenaria anguillulae PL171]|uniref:Homeobox domain-containing protein n=1 Tax=Catenaria anguillulae PL171 TaxID=765915 RepID=A0A1Y2HEZ2_9FUNG|nr:hypothetical protein BCR44DRAFT_1440260 [Catenaria anguillulae PL171]